MDIEKHFGGQKQRVNFEIDKESGFQERIVAIKALDTAVANVADNPEKFRSLAELGVAIMALDASEEVEGKTTTVPTSLEMTIDEAQLLHDALSAFTADTTESITGAMRSGSTSAPVGRAHEHHMAAAMQAQIEEGFGIPADKPAPAPVGF